MFKITIDNEEVITDKDFTIEEEMLNTPSVILNNVYPKEWETEKDYLNFYHPNEYSKCKIFNEEITPASEGSTVEGTDFSITYDDTKEFSLLSLKGETSQETTTGKNLCKPIATATKQGMTLTNNNDGSYTLNGTASANTSFYITGLNYSTGTYTLSLNNQIANSNGSFYMQAEYSGGSIRQAFTYVNATKTGTTTNPITAWSIVIPNGLSLSNFKFKPMIESGSTAHTFEEYTGGIASPNPSYPQEVQTISGRQEVEILGKNLFDTNNVLETDKNKRLNTSGGYYSEIGYFVSNMIKIEPSTTYTISYTPTALTRICYYSSNTTSSFISKNDNQQTFTTPSNAQYLMFCNLMTEMNNIQLEKGNTATTYEEYKGQTYELDLGKNMLSLTNNQTITSAGITAQVQHGWIILNGTATAISTIRFPIASTIVYADESYTLSANNTSQVSGSGIILSVGNTADSYTQTNFSSVNAKRTFKKDSATTYNRLTISTASGTTYNNYIIKPQLEKGTKASEYSDYKEPIELCKIGNYQDYIRKSQGVNLFDDFTRTLNDNQYGYREGNTYISLSRNGSACWYFKMLVNPNEVFTISYSNRQTMDFKYRFSNEDMNDSSTIATYVNNGTNITQSGQVITNTDYKYFYMTLRYTYNASPARGSISDIQLEKGNQASPYEPYDSEGQWYLYKAIGKKVVDGTDSTYGGGTTGTNAYYCATNIVALNDNTIEVAYSNMFRPCSFNNRVNGLDVVYSQNGNVNLRTANNTSIDWSTAANRKSWLTANTPSVYYISVAPETTIIEDTDLLRQLDAISLLNGINYITVSSPNLVAPLKIHYNFNEEVIDQELYFCGVVKNSGNISLNPREPHFQSLQVLSYKTFLSEGETLDFVIYEKTIREAIEQVVSAISDYGFIVGDINILNPDEIIGAYSTKDKSAYDVFQYIADITQSRWTTRMIDEDTIAIDFYDPTLMELGTTIDYTKEFFEENLIDNMFYSYGTNDYRNKQVMTSQQVYSNINQTQNIVANGYQTQFNTEQNIGKINSILVDNVSYSFATNTEKEMGVSADFYYSAGNNYIESASTISVGKVITIDYLPIVEGRQIITNAYEIDRVANSTGVKGIVARYENRNDATTSTELQLIGQSYIKYKGTPEIILTVVSRKDLWNVGQRVPFNAPIDELATEYMVRKKAVNRITTIDTLFYTYELTSSFNSETAVNYFDNQRAKANGNIGDGEYISRNIDIESQARIVFYDSSATVITTTGDNKLNCTLESPFVE